MLASGQGTGPTDTILHSPANDYTRQLLAAVPRPGWHPARARLSPGRILIVREAENGVAFCWQTVPAGGRAPVCKHVGNIFAKLRLPQTDDTNRRVLAVLAYLRSGIGSR